MLRHGFPFTICRKLTGSFEQPFALPGAPQTFQKALFFHLLFPLFGLRPLGQAQDFSKHRPFLLAFSNQLQQLTIPLIQSNSGLARSEPAIHPVRPRPAFRYSSLLMYFPDQPKIGQTFSKKVKKNSITLFFQWKSGGFLPAE